MNNSSNHGQALLSPSKLKATSPPFFHYPFLKREVPLSLIILSRANKILLSALAPTECNLVI